MFLILVNTGATLRDRLFKKTVGITRHKGSELQKKKTGVGRLSVLCNLNQLISHRNIKLVSCRNKKFKSNVSFLCAVGDLGIIGVELSVTLTQTLVLSV